jgi:outer membrane lipoprotein-sorting protein
MNEQLVKEILQEQVEREMPTSQNMWPGIRGRIGVGERNRSATQQRGMMSMLKPVLVAGVAAMLLAIGIISWLAQPAAVDAAEILARSERAASAPGVKSFHGVWSSQQRSQASEPFFASHNESWYLAPYNRRSEGRSVGHDGKEVTSSILQDEKTIWVYPVGVCRLSDDDVVILKNPDESIPVFGGTNLESVTGSGWLSQWYDPKLVGTEDVLGRSAYVIEFTLKPRDQWLPDQFPSQVARMTYWVDQQAYFVLKLNAWDAEGNELVEGGFTSYQLDAPIDPSIFSFTLPAGAQIRDTRVANAEELNALWKQAAQQVPFKVYRPTVWSAGEREGRPYYDATHGTLTQAFPRANRMNPSVTQIEMPVIAQKRASNKNVPGNGEMVKVGDTTGLYAKGESTYTLTIVRDGTQITLSWPVVQGGGNRLDRMVEIAESLELVQK